MRRRIWIVGLVLVTLVLVSNIVLWITQGRHNQLSLDLDAQYSPGQSPQPGEIFASTLSAIMDHELASGSGWRPNDFLLWGPQTLTDNNANRQLGILQAVRESMRVFKDHLTKVSSDHYDPDLVEADTLFRNDPTKLWFPSAESRFHRGIERLRSYIAGLHDGSQRSRPITIRHVELIRLFQVWTDLLGDAHANLYKEQEADGSSVWWQSDDYFYHAQGYAHAMGALMQALQHEYRQVLDERPVIRELFQGAQTALEHAALMNPFVILNGSPSGLFANHRRNLDTYIIEARQKMYSLREELEK
jgi:hypothetical protein